MKSHEPSPDLYSKYGRRARAAAIMTGIVGIGTLEGGPLITVSEAGIEASASAEVLSPSAELKKVNLEIDSLAAATPDSPHYGGRTNGGIIHTLPGHKAVNTKIDYVQIPSSAIAGGYDLVGVSHLMISPSKQPVDSVTMIVGYKKGVSQGVTYDLHREDGNGVYSHDDIDLKISGRGIHGTKWYHLGLNRQKVGPNNEFGGSATEYADSAAEVSTQLNKFFTLAKKIIK
jgi:hypothetical protein